MIFLKYELLIPFQLSLMSRQQEPPQEYKTIPSGSIINPIQMSIIQHSVINCYLFIRVEHKQQSQFMMDHQAQMQAIHQRNNR
jgi:hypothetical protein